MIALIAAGRDGGGHGDPVFFTVPWSPSIAERGQLPGSVWGGIQMLHTVMRLMGEDLADFCRISEALLFTIALKEHGTITAAIGVVLARRIMLELGMLP